MMRPADYIFKSVKGICDLFSAFVVLVLCSFQSLMHRVLPLTIGERLKAEASTFINSSNLKVEELSARGLLVAIYPKRINIKVLNWVGQRSSVHHSQER